MTTKDPAGVGAPQTPESPEADAFRAAREALARLRGQGRDDHGRATVGNTLALRDGLRSARLWAEPAVATWHRERVEALQADLGADVSAVRQSLLESFARLELVEAGLGENLFQHGPLTSKGRQRAALTAWLGVLGHKVRLAAQIGLERQARQVPASLADTLRAGAIRG